MNYVVSALVTLIAQGTRWRASPNAHQGKNQTIPMFQEKIDELGQKTCPQEAPETIFETQGRGQYTPQMASLRKEHLSNGGWTKSEYQSGPDRIVKSNSLTGK